MLWLFISSLSASAFPVESHLIGSSTGHRPIVVEQFGNGEERIFFISTIHGNEYAGSLLLPLLAQELYDNPQWLEQKSVFMMQLANPDGFVDSERSNRNWVDLNRNFPSNNHRNSRRGGGAPLSEFESRGILNAIQSFNPDRVITLHEPFRCIDYDGPGFELAQMMSDAGPLEIKKLGTKSGSLGSFLGRNLNIPVVTVEFPYGSYMADPQEMWDSYGNMLVQGVIYPQILQDGLVEED